MVDPMPQPAPVDPSVAAPAPDVPAADPAPTPNPEAPPAAVPPSPLETESMIHELLDWLNLGHDAARVGTVAGWIQKYFTGA